MIVKSDQESSINSLVDEIGRMRAAEGSAGRWVKEHFPVGSSASNGIVERAVQSVEGQVRVLKLALEKRWGAEIPSKHAVIPWMIEYAAYLLNRFEVGHDGKTAYERLKGKRARSFGVEFGEAVHWKVNPTGGAPGKLSSSWEHGVYLGVRGKSGEIIVTNGEGVWKTRTIQRKPADERWLPSSAELVKMSPWSKKDEQDKGNDIPVAIKMREDEAEIEKQVPGREAVPRNFYISAKDLKEHGFSAKCPGCLSILRGKIRQAHSAACRKRFESLLADSDKVKRADHKITDRLAKLLEREDEQQKIKKAKANNKEQEDNDMNIKGKDEPRDVAMKESPAQGGPAEEAKTDEKMDGGVEAPGSGSSPSGLTAEERARSREEPEAKRKKVTMKEALYNTWNDPEILELHAEEFEDGPDEMEDIYDEKSGELLDPELVRSARHEEVEFMKKIQLYEEAPIEECWKMTGRPPIDTKWVDLNKGSVETPDVRCRLVARDFKPKGEKDRGDLFAAMPPLEAKKLLFRMAAASEERIYEGKRERRKLMFFDIKKAHLNGKCGEDEFVYVVAPAGRGSTGMWWRLNRWLYGMRPAASAWEADYSEKLSKFGMTKGKSAPTVFYDEGRDLRCVVHGDDFSFLGWERDLHEAADFLKSVYELKVKGILGDGPNDVHEVVILNRRLSWKDGVLTYEADPKHAELVWEGMGLDPESKGLHKPCVKETVGEVEDDETNSPLSPKEATEFRALAARANYLAMDRPDVQFAVKEACRDMAAPTRASWQKVKRIARFLLEFPRLVWRFGGEPVELEILEVFADSDWAGCLRTRRSTSGGVVMLGGVALKHWSSTQASIALSSAEAEYTALVKAASEGLRIQAIAKDLGWSLRVRVHTDSSAAKSIASRSGVGKVRHLATKILWVQEAVKEGRFEVAKVRGDRNWADILTKPKSAEEMAETLGAMNAVAVQRGLKPLPVQSIFQVRARSEDGLARGVVSGIRHLTHGYEHSFLQTQSAW